MNPAQTDLDTNPLMRLGGKTHGLRPPEPRTGAVAAHAEGGPGRSAL